MAELPSFTPDPELMKIIISQAGDAAQINPAFMTKAQIDDIGRKISKTGLTMGEFFQNQQEYKALLQAQQDLLDQQQRQQDIQAFNLAAKNAAGSTPGLTQDGYPVVHDRLTEMKNQFITADKKERALLLDQLNNMSTDIANTSTFMTDTLPNAAVSATGINDDYKTTVQGQDLAGIMPDSKSGEVGTKLVERNGKLGWMIHEDGAFEDATQRFLELDNEIAQLKKDYESGRISEETKMRAVADMEEEKDNIEDVIQSGGKVFKTATDLEDIIKHQSFDTQSQEVINAAVLNQMNLAEKVLPNETGEFNYKPQYDIMKAQVVKKGNLRSLVHDPHVGDVSFKENITLALEETTYHELGIVLEKEFGVSREDVEMNDPNTDNDPTRISKDDAEIIVSTLVDDEEMLIHYLSTYFTNFLEQNWYNNIPMDHPQRATPQAASDQIMNRDYA